MRLLKFIPLVLALAVAARGADWVAPAVPGEGTFPSEKVVRVWDTGAVGDGVTLCSEAIGKAIDQCAGAGGGIVEFPARLQKQTEPNPNPVPTVYLTGTIHLKSNITLQIDEGVTLRFTTDRTQYPLVRTRWECTDVMNYSPLIYAYQCENVRITGKGTIDGQGQAWWEWAGASRQRMCSSSTRTTGRGRCRWSSGCLGSRCRGCGRA